MPKSSRVSLDCRELQQKLRDIAKSNNMGDMYMTRDAARLRTKSCRKNSTRSKISSRKKPKRRKSSTTCTKTCRKN